MLMEKWMFVDNKLEIKACEIPKYFADQYKKEKAELLELRKQSKKIDGLENNLEHCRKSCRAYCEKYLQAREALRSIENITQEVLP